MENSGVLPAGELPAPPPPLHHRDPVARRWRSLGLASMVVSSAGLVHSRREELYWYQFRLYCLFLAGWILVVLPFGAHNYAPARRAGELIATFLLAPLFTRPR